MIYNKDINNELSNDEEEEEEEEDYIS